jgi:hypothetical protein
MASSRRLRHTTKLPGRSTKVYLRLASPVAFATNPTLGSLLHSPVWSVEEAPPTPTICGSPNPAQWGARSATSSPYPCAESITETSIASETKSPGGRDGPLIPSRRRGCSGFRRAVSNENGIPNGIALPNNLPPHIPYRWGPSSVSKGNESDTTSGLSALGSPSEKTGSIPGGAGRVLSPPRVAAFPPRSPPEREKRMQQGLAKGHKVRGCTELDLERPADVGLSCCSVCATSQHVANKRDCARNAFT